MKSLNFDTLGRDLDQSLNAGDRDALDSGERIFVCSPAGAKTAQKPSAAPVFRLK
jgi:hypothetical protein